MPINPASNQRFEFPGLPNQNHTLLALLAGAAQGYATQKAEKQKEQATLLANALPSLVKAGYDPSGLMKKQGIDIGQRRAGYVDYETLKDQAAYMKDMQDMARKQANRSPQTPEEWQAALKKAQAIKMIQDTVGYPVTMGPSGMTYGKVDPFSGLLGGGESDPVALDAERARAFQGIMDELYGPSLNNPNPNPNPAYPTKAEIDQFVVDARKKKKSESEIAGFLKANGLEPSYFGVGDGAPTVTKSSAPANIFSQAAKGGVDPLYYRSVVPTLQATGGGIVDFLNKAAGSWTDAFKKKVLGK